MNKQHKMTLSQCDFYHLLFFGNMILYHLKSILFTVDPWWVHNPLSSGVIWEHIYITQQIYEPPEMTYDEPVCGEVMVCNKRSVPLN